MSDFFDCNTRENRVRRCERKNVTRDNHIIRITFIYCSWCMWPLHVLHRHTAYIVQPTRSHANISLLFTCRLANIVLLHCTNSSGPTCFANFRSIRHNIWANCVAGGHLINSVCCRASRICRECNASSVYAHAHNLTGYFIVTDDRLCVSMHAFSIVQHRAAPNNNALRNSSMNLFADWCTKNKMNNMKEDINCNYFIMIQ